MNDAAEILAQFILEARECLETIGQRLLQIERDPTNLELLNDLFRSVHTLKGNCGMFEFEALERVVHAGEDVLDRVRAGKLPYTSAMADLLLAAMDHSAEMIDALDGHGELPASADQHSHQLARDLRAFLQDTPLAAAASPAALVQAAPVVVPGAPVAAVPVAPAWVQALPAEWQRAGACAVRYLPEPECFFKGEDPWRWSSRRLACWRCRWCRRPIGDLRKTLTATNAGWASWCCAMRRWPMWKSTSAMCRNSVNGG